MGVSRLPILRRTPQCIKRIPAVGVCLLPSLLAELLPELFEGFGLRLPAGIPVTELHCCCMISLDAEITGDPETLTRRASSQCDRAHLDRAAGYDTELAVGIRRELYVASERFETSIAVVNHELVPVAEDKIAFKRNSSEFPG